MPRLKWVQKGERQPDMLKGIHLSDRGTLTIPSDVYQELGSPTSVDIAIVQDQAKFVVTPGSNWSVYSRKGKSSPQISMGTAIRKMGVQEIMPGKRPYELKGDRLIVSLLPE